MATRGRHIYWEGRYPAPQKERFYPKKFTEDNIPDWPNSYVIYPDIELIKKVLKELQVIIHNKFKK